MLRHHVTHKNIHHSSRLGGPQVFTHQNLNPDISRLFWGPNLSHHTQIKEKRESKTQENLTPLHHRKNRWCQVYTPWNLTAKAPKNGGFSRGISFSRGLFSGAWQSVSFSKMISQNDGFLMVFRCISGFKHGVILGIDMLDFRDCTPLILKIAPSGSIKYQTTRSSEPPWHGRLLHLQILAEKIGHKQTQFHGPMGHFSGKSH